MELPLEHHDLINLEYSLVLLKENMIAKRDDTLLRITGFLLLQHLNLGVDRHDRRFERGGPFPQDLRVDINQ